MAETLITLVFIAGYSAIALEQKIKINKAASAILTGVICWMIFIGHQADKVKTGEMLLDNLGDIAAILFFLLSAMAIVELIDAHDGFGVISEKIRTGKKNRLLWLIGLVTFFMSAMLDNLTTTIVMVSLVRKMIHERRDRMIFAGIIVIAANAGGAWSPIGDVTTTMLWMGNQVTAERMVLRLILPSLVCVIVPLLLLSVKMRKEPDLAKRDARSNVRSTSPTERNLIFWTGIISLLFIPVFKGLTDLPPLMGMLFSLGVMWVITEIILMRKDDEDKRKLSITAALQKADTPTILFFLGILLCISALRSVGLLQNWADWLTAHLRSESLLILITGMLSSVIDNVPLVAAVQGMYPLSDYPANSFLWEFLAYAAGTGGSILIIGSAAGVAAMGMEKIDFIWYLKRISWVALTGYLAGAAVYILQSMILHY